MVLLLVVLNFIHLVSQSFKFKLLSFLENEFFHIFSFKLCQCKFWNSSVLVTDICEACEIQTQSFFQLNMFECSHKSLFPSFILKYLSRMLILRKWQVFFIMPIFFIKTNVFQHKSIHRFNIGSRCLNLCISSPKLTDVGQRDCPTAQVLCAGSCCLPPQGKVTSWNSEFLNFHYSCEDF